MCKKYKVRCYFQSSIFYNYSTDYVCTANSEFEALVDVCLYVTTSVNNDEVVVGFSVYDYDGCDFI